VITVCITYFIAAVVASGIFVVAGWRSKQTRTLAAARSWNGPPSDPLWGDEETHFDPFDMHADVGVAIRVALKRLAPVMASQSVQADIASPPSVRVRMESAALEDLLEELLAAAIHCAPASRLLMTATTHGDLVHIGVTDDMPGADAALRQGSMRGLMGRVARRGGTLDVNVRPAEGTTMTLKLAAVTVDNHLPRELIPNLSAMAGGFALRTER
jgi:hypothetical protein